MPETLERQFLPLNFALGWLSKGRLCCNQLPPLHATLGCYVGTYLPTYLPTYLLP